MKRVLILLVIVFNISFSEEMEKKFDEKLKVVNEEVLVNKKEIEYVKKQYDVDLDRIENEKEVIKGKFDFLMWLLSIVGITSLAGIVGVVIESIKMWKSIDKKVRERIGIEISDIVKVEKKKIEEIVKKYDVEEQLKEDKRICVLFNEEKDNKNIKEILKGFKVEYFKFSKEKYIKDYDLIIFNNEDGKINMSDMQNMVLSNLEKFYFYYNATGLFYPKDKSFGNKEKLNFCSSIYTLYSNVIDLLRTQNLLNK